MARNDDEKIVMEDSDEAATFRTDLSGWVARDGSFCGKDERSARYIGCTHCKCEDCGEPTRKSYTHCEACRDKRAQERHDALPTKEWDEKTMIYSNAFDRWFQDFDDFADFVEQNGIEDLRAMRLVHSDPVFAHELDADDWRDELAEDQECPDWLCVIIDEANAKIKAQGEPLSYWPNEKLAVDIAALAHAIMWKIAGMFEDCNTAEGGDHAE